MAKWSWEEHFTGEIFFKSLRMQLAQNTGSRVTSWQTLPDRHGTTCLLLPKQDFAELGEGFMAGHQYSITFYWPLSLTGNAKAGHGKCSRSLQVRSSLIRLFSLFMEQFFYQVYDWFHQYISLMAYLSPLWVSTIKPIIHHFKSISGLKEK